MLKPKPSRKLEDCREISGLAEFATLQADHDDAEASEKVSRVTTFAYFTS
jgi:hypothetical protein